MNNHLNNRDDSTQQRHDDHGDTGGQDVQDVQAPRCVALTQDRRGHGQSTLAWYLAHALVAAGLRVLVVDISGRHERLEALARAGTGKNLGIWKPKAPRPEYLAALIQSAREQTRGRVDVLLLDCDIALLESAGGFALPIDYALALIDPTPTGQQTADHLAERLGDAPPPYGRLGVVLSRVSEPEAIHFPQQTEDRRLPVLGYLPADYLLAGDESSQRHRGPPSAPIAPHEGYTQAVQRLSRVLMRLADLRHSPPDPLP